MVRLTTIKRILNCSILLLSFTVSAQVKFADVTSVNMPNTPEELAKGDFNNDGLIDLVSCNFNGFANQQVTLLLNTGTGNFTGTNVKSFSATGNALDVAVGDFNEDGNLDLVTCSQPNDNFSLLLGNGAGSFAAPVNFAAGDTPQGIAVGDMNKDNNLDVLVTNRGTPSDVYIFLGNGSGGFSAPTVISINFVWDVAVGDFNNDTNPDFAVSIGSPASIRLYTGDGSGAAFTSGTSVTGFAGAEDLIAADIDNDSDLDIIAGGGYTLGDGAGNFSPRVLLLQTGYEYTVGDVNKDGNPDIIANDHNQNYTNMRVFLGNGAGAFTFLAKFECNIYFYGVEIVDVNNDSNPDVVGTGTWGGINRTDVFIGDGTGYFNSVIKYPTTTDPRDMVKGDFNEDGMIDVALCHSISTNNISIYLGLGQGRFMKATGTYNAGLYPNQILAIDYNKDTHLDLVTFNLNSTSSVTIFTGDGTGQFSALPNIPVATNLGHITAADFNNDTNIDLVAAGGTGKMIYLLIGTGSGFNAPSGIPVTEDIYEVKAADFDNNGNQDIAATFYNANKLLVLFGNGAGGFTEGTQHTSATDFLEVYDLNNDSRPDILATNAGINGNNIFINDGTGNFTGSEFAPYGGSTGIGYDDMDGDGTKDMVIGGQNSISSSPGFHSIYKGTGTGTFVAAEIYSKNASGGNKLLTHDVNGDGKPDIITTSFNIYEDYLAVMINATTTVTCVPPSVSSLSPDATICAGSPATFSVTATGTAPFTYQWKKATINIPGATNDSFTIALAGAGDAASYTVTITNACGSVTSNASVLTVNTVPPPAVTNSDRCGAGTLTLTASGSTNGNYRWYDVASGGVPIPGEVNGSFTTPSLSETTSYYVSIHTGTCESGRIQVTATVDGPSCSNQPPVITTTSLNVLAEGAVTIDLLTLISDADDNLDISSLKVTEPPPSGALTSIANGILTVDYEGISFTGAETLTVEACDLPGSCVEEVLTIEVTEGIIVYNGISPNGDLLNATWQIKNINLLPGAQRNKVTIYNRWGDEVFSVVDYDNTERVFKGISNSGGELPSGTYFYKIEFGDLPAKNGYLVIKK